MLDFRILRGWNANIKMPMRDFRKTFRVSRGWNTNTKMPIRYIRTRLQGITGLENLYEDAYTRYQDETSGSQGLRRLI